MVNLCNNLFLNFQYGICSVSPTECFLRYLTLPEDETISVDLRQCAVVIMCHLDRLALPYMPPSEAQRSQSVAVNQEVLAWGWLAWQGSAGGATPLVLDSLNELGGVQMLVCSEKGLLALTRTGKVYSLLYKSETQVCLSMLIWIQMFCTLNWGI